MSKLKLPFGLMTGELIHISDAKRGLACGCVCPSCKLPLIARKGDITAHHFAHYQQDECAGAIETALHLATKQILSKVRKITLPPVYIYFDEYQPSKLVSPEHTVILDQVYEEHRTHNIVPDVLAYSGKTPLIIEVFVTHGINAQKRGKIRLLGISAIQISFSKADFESIHTQLEDAVISRTDNKRWIFNAKAEMLKHQFLAIAEKRHVISVHPETPCFIFVDLT